VADAGKSTGFVPRVAHANRDYNDDSKREIVLKFIFKLKLLHTPRMSAVEPGQSATTVPPKASGLQRDPLAHAGYLSHVSRSLPAGDKKAKQPRINPDPAKIDP
jgi:hypothetical protein